MYHASMLAPSTDGAYVSSNARISLPLAPQALNGTGTYVA
jgi:hypothetical protein